MDLERRFYNVYGINKINEFMAKRYGVGSFWQSDRNEDASIVL